MKAIATAPISMNVGGEELTFKIGDVLEGRAAVAAVNAGKAKAEPTSRAKK